MMVTKDEYVVVKTFGSEMDALVAKAHLESKGIKAVIIKDDVGGMQPNFQTTSGVSLAVSIQDKQKAKKLLG